MAEREEAPADFVERRSVSPRSCDCYPDTHRLFVDQWIERERAKAERWEKIETQVLGWGIVSAIGALGAFAGRKFGLV